MKKKSEMFVLSEKYKRIGDAINNAYLDWKNTSAYVTPAKYIWFQHHTEIVLGFSCRVDYDSRIVSDIEVVDEGKFMLFMLRYS